MKNNRIRVAAMAAVAAAAIAAPALATHSWGNYHWATTSNVLTVKMNAALTGSWPGYMDTAILDWEVSNNLSLGSRINVSVNRKQCSPLAGKILVCNDSYGQRGWLGIASIWTDSTGHISQGTTKVNDTYFNMTQYNTPAWRLMVMCQEIGHDFGLDHQDETFANTNLGTCMDYTNNPLGPPTNEHPNQHDYDQLATIYHGDGFTTASSTAATNFGVRGVGQAVPQAVSSAPAGDSPAEWGRAVHRDELGRPDVFVKDFGGKRQMITHVLWALETKRSDIE